MVINLAESASEISLLIAMTLQRDVVKALTEFTPFNSSSVGTQRLESRFVRYKYKVSSAGRTAALSVKFDKTSHIWWNMLNPILDYLRFQESGSSDCTPIFVGRQIRWVF